MMESFANREIWIMEKQNNTLAFLGLYEKLVREGVIDEFPMTQYRPEEFKMKRHSIRFPSGIHVEFNAMERTVYTLFLRHPEGCTLRDRWQFYTELMEIYRCQSDSSDPDWRERRIDDLCDDKTANFSSYIYRIRRKLLQSMPPVDADRFSIKRHADGVYRIDALKK